MSKIQYRYNHSPKGKYRSYAMRCRRDGRDFDLTLEVFTAMIMTPCYYCGYSNPKHMGIDRVDSAEGYVEGNCVPCCKHCNFGKHNQTEKDFLDRARRIVKIHGDR